WRRYNDIEREAILGRARAFGWLRYDGARALPDGTWRLTLAVENAHETVWSRFDDLDDRQDLQADDQLPPELREGAATESKARRGDPPPFVGQLVGRRMQPPSVDLRPDLMHEDRRPPKAGFVFV